MTNETKTSYEGYIFDKFTEVDDFEKGCLPETTINIDVTQCFKGDTLESVLYQMRDFVGADNSEMLLNSCDELGRVDFQILENGDGYRASKDDIDAWKEGKKILWLSTYVGCIELVTRERVSFERITRKNVDLNN